MFDSFMSDFTQNKLCMYLSLDLWNNVKYVQKESNIE